MIYSEKFLNRFWNKIDIRNKSECWIWKASKYDFGYGQIKADAPFRHNLISHVVSLEIKLNRKLLPGMCCLHVCDNPSCCNPDHLYEGSVQQNSDDKMNRGRHKNGPTEGEDNGNAVLSNQDIPVIVNLILTGHSNKEIAAMYNVTHSTISLIRNKKKWIALLDSIGFEAKPCFIRS
ncbi:MAG: helix-turn-helix domain-containing protein [Pseudomonadota bacterium]|nr:helix-turn-helix domain-containing protein [Pseudomonadota bacterium]